MNENDAQTVHDRTREIAYEIWLAEGCPEGRADQHWELARMKVALDDTQESMRKSARPPEPEPARRAEAKAEAKCETLANSRRTNGGDKNVSFAGRETAWFRWREWMRGA